MSSNESITVLIYLPGRCLLEVRVSLHSPICDLDKVLTCHSQHKFIHEGALIKEQYLFSDYKFRMRDVIVALPMQIGVEETNKWLRITRDSDSLHDRFDELLRPSSESFRIRDYQFLSMERKPRAFRRLCANYTNFVELNSLASSSTLPTNLNWPKPTSPSSEPLPALWNSTPSAPVERSNLSHPGSIDGLKSAPISSILKEESSFE